jgi:hypothetical protein
MEALTNHILIPNQKITKILIPVLASAFGHRDNSLSKSSETPSASALHAEWCSRISMRDSAERRWRFLHQCRYTAQTAGKVRFRSKTLSIGLEG